MTDTSSWRQARRSTDPVQSVARALELLEALRDREYVTIAELVRLHGVHRATTLRLLQTLEHFGYVTRGRNRGEFRLGPTLYELGAVFGERSELLRAARPVMRHLAATTGETIDLALFDCGEVVIIESIAAQPSCRVGSPIGRRVAAPCTTTGKLYLASMPPHAVARELATHGLPRVGPKSITDRAQLLGQLAQIRATGYAVNDEETDANVHFVGVSMRLPDCRGHLGLILGAPTNRLPPSAFPGVARMLNEAALRIAEVA